MAHDRQAFDVKALDRMLGGGLLPGTLTVIAGATGVGKTQLGLRWADAGRHDGGGRRGVVCDLTSRGDTQNHIAYARDQFDWTLLEEKADSPLNLACVFRDRAGDYFHPFAHAGRRVTRRDLEPDDWHAWKSDLARILRLSVGFFYRNFIAGSRRVVVDGIEPVERFSESIQFEFFEYLYHNILRKESDWAARELFRELYRAHEAEVAAHAYDFRSIGCLYLYTTPKILLDEMIAEPLGEGDVFANANTIILMGRVRREHGLGRALYVAKHRGSACEDEIRPYHINERGIIFE